MYTDRRDLSKAKREEQKRQEAVKYFMSHGTKTPRLPEKSSFKSILNLFLARRSLGLALGEIVVALATLGILLYAAFHSP